MKKFYVLLTTIICFSFNIQAQVSTSTQTGNDSAGVLNYFILNASTASDSYSTEFYFNVNASAGFDLGFDAELFGVPPDFSIYSLLVEENIGDPIALQSLHTTNLDNTTIPIGLNAMAGEELTIRISTSTLSNSIEIFLDDTTEGITTLLTSSDYVFTPTSQLSGTGRFFIRTNDTSLSTIENNLDNITIFALNNSKELVINGQLEINALLNLYDIQGKLVLNIPLDNTLSQNRIDVSSLNGGLYVVKVLNNKQQKSQKVIIK